MATEKKEPEVVLVTMTDGRKVEFTGKRKLLKEAFADGGFYVHTVTTAEAFAGQALTGMFNAYFLIVWDLIRYARGEGIRVGPGRGSAAGCAVAYCLRITDLDPLKYDLLFERFLNPSRVSMPDIAERSSSTAS